MAKSKATKPTRVRASKKSTTPKTTKRKEKYNGQDCIRAGELAPFADTPHHKALKLLSEWHAGNEDACDQLVEHFTYLTHSPHFRPFLERAKAPVENLPDPNWNLAWFGAEMFAAGVLAVRREFARKASVYDCELEHLHRRDISRKQMYEHYRPLTGTSKGGAR